jgi:hypothetical protein
MLYPKAKGRVFMKKFSIILFSIFVTNFGYANDLNWLYGVSVECRQSSKDEMSCDELKALAMAKGIRIGGETSPIRSLYLGRFNLETDYFGQLHADPRSEDYIQFLSTQSNNQILANYIPLVQDLNNILSNMYGVEVKCSPFTSAADCFKFQTTALANPIFIGNTTIRRLILDDYNSQEFLGDVKADPTSTNYLEFLKSQL